MQALIDSLRARGVARLSQIPWIDEFTEHLSKCVVHLGHVRSRPRHGIFCNSMEDVMAAPHFLEYARALTPIASEYFRAPAHLWSLNAFYTDESTPYIGSVNGLHRDREADKILVLFVLGYDTAIDGAQILVNDRYDGAEVIYGPAGTAWLADTTCLHCGLLPRKPRMIAWARWAPNERPAAAQAEQLPLIEAA